MGSARAPVAASGIWPAWIASVSGWKRLSAIVPRSDRSPRRDDAGVDAGPVEAAEQPRVLDLHAAVHDDLEPRCGSERGGLPVLDADLLPQALGADRDRLLGDRQHVLGLAKDVDDVDRDLDRRQRRVTALAEDRFVARIDGDDAVAVLLHVLGGEVARPEPVGRQADDGDRPARAQDAAKGRDVVGHGREARAVAASPRHLNRNGARGSRYEEAVSRGASAPCASSAAAGGSVSRHAGRCTRTPAVQSGWARRLTISRCRNASADRLESSRSRSAASSAAGPPRMARARTRASAPALSPAAGTRTGNAASTRACIAGSTTAPASDALPAATTS